MKKQRNQLCILIILLAVLAGALLGIRQYNKVQSTKPDEVSGEAIVSAALNDIIKFSYDYEGETLEFVKEDDIWYYAADTSIPIKQYQITSMLNNVYQIIATETLEHVTDLSQYGLEEPQNTVSFETPHASYIFYLGDYNELSGVTYLSRPSEATVYAVAAFTADTFQYSLAELTEETEPSTEESMEMSMETSMEISTETSTEISMETSTE